MNKHTTDLLRANPELQQCLGGPHDFSATLVFHASARQVAGLPPWPGDAALLQAVQAKQEPR